jgi:polyadenylate-binding protein
LYLRGFPAEFTEENINKFIEESFKLYGIIVSKGIFRSNEHNSFYCFVSFENPEDAKKAQEELNGHNFENSEAILYVNIAQSKAARRNNAGKNLGQFNTNIYIKGLKDGTSEDQLREVFSAYGEITSVLIKSRNLNVDGEEVVSGFGFINFKTPDESKRALLEGKKD